MKPHLLEALRWTAIALCGGSAIWFLLALVEIIDYRGERESFAWFVIPYYLLIAAPFLATAYFCYRRQYRKIYLVVGAVGCAVVYLSLMTLPDKLGLYHALDSENTPGEPILGFLIIVASFVVPIYAAAWFYRAFAYLAHRHESVPRRKTRANSWLVAGGLFLMFIPAVLWLNLLEFATQSPSAAEDSARAGDWMFLAGDLSLLGAAMIIAGLAWRRPVVEPTGETPVKSDDGQMPELNN